MYSIVSQYSNILQMFIHRC